MSPRSIHSKGSAIPIHCRSGFWYFYNSLACFPQETFFPPSSTTIINHHHPASSPVSLHVFRPSTTSNTSSPSFHYQPIIHFKATRPNHNSNLQPDYRKMPTTTEQADLNVESRKCMYEDCKKWYMSAEGAWSGLHGTPHACKDCREKHPSEYKKWLYIPEKTA
jgi:hypothetical protein